MFPIASRDCRAETKKRLVKSVETLDQRVELDQVKSALQRIEFEGDSLHLLPRRFESRYTEKKNAQKFSAAALPLPPTFRMRNCCEGSDVI
jgi:hypothetical protein